MNFLVPATNLVLTMMVVKLINDNDDDDDDDDEDVDDDDNDDAYCAFQL